MVRKVFWEDPYLTTLNTKIASVNGRDVTLVSTILFAFSGGQESDYGTIDGLSVLEARKSGLDIIYSLEDGHGLSEGQSVDVIVDWERRRRLMQHHFAAEMVLQLVYKAIPGILRVGAHISPQKARIDFETERSLTPLVAELERDANALVRANRPIVTGYSDEPAQRRFWKVEGFAEMACGGTHLRSTMEVGTINLKRRNPGKGKERLEIEIA